MHSLKRRDSLNPSRGGLGSKSRDIHGERDAHR